jgi:hypothetical protein
MRITLAVPWIPLLICGSYHGVYGVSENDLIFYISQLDLEIFEVETKQEESRLFRNLFLRALKEESNLIYILMDLML